MPGIWLTADLHFGHRLVSDLRGFENTDAHDDTITRHWRRMIGTHDVVWVLGDISGGGAAAQTRALELLAGLPGRKCLVAGNHDSVHPMFGLNVNLRWMPLYAEVFEWIGSVATLKAARTKVQLSHFPLAADHTETARYVKWRMPDTQQWLAHGHTHSRTGFVGRELHVGLDAHRLRPVPLSAVADHVQSHGDSAATEQTPAAADDLAP